MKTSKQLVLHDKILARQHFQFFKCQMSNTQRPHSILLKANIS